MPRCGSSATTGRPRDALPLPFPPDPTPPRARPEEFSMTDPVARAAALLKDHRESIDRLDAILVFTLAERFKHTQAVGVLKAQHALPPSDPAREERQIARLQDLATQADLDPEFAKKFLNFVIQEVIQHHKQHQS
jgi:chorismate mutase